MNKDKFTVGDILLTRGNYWISKVIRYFMEKYRKNLGLKPMEVYSHAAMVIDMWGVLYVTEALQGGITITPLEEAYGKYSLKDLKLKTPRKSYSKSERECMSKIASKNAFRPTRYDFLALLWQIKRVNHAKNTVDPNWSGSTEDKATRRLYCTEACAYWSNQVRPNTFKEPWATNPLDVDINQYYIDKDIN